MIPSKEVKQRDSIQTVILTSLICTGLVMTLYRMTSSLSPQLLVLLLCLFVVLSVYSLWLLSHYR